MKKFDVWMCYHCGRTVTAPIPRNYEPYTLCGMHFSQEYPGGFMSVMTKLVPEEEEDG